MIAVVKAVRDATGLTLVNAKRRVEKAPIDIEDVDLLTGDVHLLALNLINAGAAVEVMGVHVAAVDQLAELMRRTKLVLEVEVDEFGNYGCSTQRLDGKWWARSGDDDRVPKTHGQRRIVQIEVWINLPSVDILPGEVVDPSNDS